MVIKIYYAKFFIANMKCAKDINNVMFLTEGEIVGYRVVENTSFLWYEHYKEH